MIQSKLDLSSNRNWDMEIKIVSTKSNLLLYLLRRKESRNPLKQAKRIGYRFGYLF
jgi:hypothetical protein